MSLAVALLLAAVPQVAREPVQLAPTSFPYSLVLGSDADLSAAVWTANTDASPGEDEVLLSVSDGRGLSWSAPQTVELAPAGVGVSQARIGVVEGRAFVSWSDARFGVPALFLRVYDAAAGTLGPEVEIPTGQPVDVTTIQRVSLDAERVGADVHVHVAFLVHVVPPGGPTYDQLVLATSIDAGASFLPALTLPLPAPPPPPYSAFPLVLQAEAGVVHVMWLDQRTGLPQVFYQRSSDGGLTFDFPADKQLTNLPYVLSFRFDARGSTLAFAVDEVFSDDPHPGFEFADVSAAVSTDGGTTFGPLQSVPSGDGVSNQTFNPAIAVGSGGVVLLAWEAGFIGSTFNVYTSRSADGGTTWSPEIMVSETLGQYAELVAAGPGRDRAVVAWFGEGYFPGGLPKARLSADGGATWGPPTTLGAPSYKMFPTQLAYNDRYQNLVAGWNGKDSPYPAFAGGFRPQTVTPAGFAPGAAQVGAAFERFDDGSPLAFFLVSTAPGDLPLPLGDLRNTGLGLTPLLLTTVNLALIGPLAAGLDGAGNGALTPIPTTLLSPLTLYALGLSFDPATLTFGDVSDVVRIDL